MYVVCYSIKYALEPIICLCCISHAAQFRLQTSEDLVTELQARLTHIGAERDADGRQLTAVKEQVCIYPIVSNMSLNTLVYLV